MAAGGQGAAVHLTLGLGQMSTICIPLYQYLCPRLRHSPLPPSPHWSSNGSPRHYRSYPPPLPSVGVIVFRPLANLSSGVLVIFLVYLGVRVNLTAFK